MGNMMRNRTRDADFLGCCQYSKDFGFGVVYTITNFGLGVVYTVTNFGLGVVYTVTNFGLGVVYTVTNFGWVLSTR